MRTGNYHSSDFDGAVAAGNGFVMTHTVMTERDPNVTFEFQPDIHASRIPIAGTGPNIRVLGYRLLSATPRLLRDRCHRIGILLRNDGDTTSEASCQIELDPSMPPTVELISGEAYCQSVQAGGVSTITESPFTLRVDPAYDCSNPVIVHVTVTDEYGGTTQKTLTIINDNAGAAPTFEATMTPAAIPDNSLPGIFLPISVSGLDPEDKLADLSLTLHLTHTYVGDLDLSLIDPSGRAWKLGRNVGGDGDNFGFDCSSPAVFGTFDFAKDIEDGTPPYVFDFVLNPMGNLRDLRGASLGDFNGLWQLRVRDTLSGDTGTVQCATLALSPSASNCLQNASLNDCGPPIGFANYVVVSPHVDNDGWLGPGECNLLGFAFGNSSPYKLTGVTATLEHSSPDLSVWNDVITFDDVLPNGVANSNEVIRVFVSSGAACPSIIDATLKVTSNELTFDVPVKLQVGRDTSLLEFYSSATGAIADASITSFDFNVTSAPSEIAEVIVSLHAKHSAVGELRVSLLAPNGTSADLILGRGLLNDNLGVDCNTPVTFRDSSTRPIGVDAYSWSPPIFGDFQPEESLSAFVGMAPADAIGMWSLVIQDTAAGGFGSLECATLSIDFATCSSESTFACGFEAEAMNATISGGNGNQRIEPFECLELTVPLLNPTIFPLRNLTVTLTAEDSVDVISGTATYPTILPGAIGLPSQPFLVQTHGNVRCDSPDGLFIFNMDLLTDTDLASIPVVQVVGGGVDSTPQVFESPAGALDIPDNASMGVVSTIAVSGVTGVLSDLNVRLHVTHPYVGDLEATLTDPNGQTFVLVKRRGGSANNFGVSCPASGDDLTFGMYASNRLSYASFEFPNPPSGVFAPEESLYSRLLGASAASLNGNWQLRVADLAASDLGKLECWSLEIGTAECELAGGGYCGAYPIASYPSAVIVPGPNGCYEFEIGIQNLGTETLTNVTGTLNVLDVSFQPIVATSAYDDIPYESVRTNAVLFRFNVDGSWVCPGDIPAQVVLNSDQGSFVVPVTIVAGPGTAPIGVVGTGPPMMISDASATIVNFNVAEPSGPLKTVALALNIDHDFVPDLDIKLVAPNGTECRVLEDVGRGSIGIGSNCGGGQAIFFDTAPYRIPDTPIDSAVALRPMDSFQNAFAGMDPADVAGTWQLVVVDDSIGIAGMIQCAELGLTFGDCVDGGGGCFTPSPSPSASPSPSNSATPTVTATASATASPSNTAIPTPTDGSTFTPSPTATASPSPSASAPPSNTPVPTPTDGSTLTPSPSASPSPTLAISPTATPDGPTPSPSPTVPPTDRQPVIDLILNLTSVVPAGADRNGDATVDAADITSTN